MSTTSINRLLSCASTKHMFSYHLAHVSLEHFEGNAVHVVVLCVAQTINPSRPTTEHSRGGWYTHSSACPEHAGVHLTGGAHLGLLTDTKALILLMDFVSQDHLSAMIMLFLLTGKGGASFRSQYKDLNKLRPVLLWKWPNLWHLWPPRRRIHLYDNF